MPLTVQCSGCSRQFRVPDEHAGKKVKCPKCQTVFIVPGPAASGQAAPQPAEEGAAVAAPAAADLWHLKLPDGQTFGPIGRQELDGWVAEGRVTSESQILHEGDSQWQWADELYPSLAEGAAAPAGDDNPFAFLDGGASAPASTAAGESYPATGHGTGVGTMPTTRPRAGGDVSDKDQATTFLFAVFLGMFGADRFYLGQTGLGIAKLLTGGGCYVWHLVDLYMTGCGVQKDSQGRPLRRPRDNPGHRSQTVAFLLAALLGYLGADRFYLGQTGLGVAKLLTFGGCGVWSAIDAIRIGMGSVRDVDNRTLT